MEIDDGEAEKSDEEKDEEMPIEGGLYHPSALRDPKLIHLSEASPPTSICWRFVAFKDGREHVYVIHRADGRLFDVSYVPGKRFLLAQYTIEPPTLEDLKEDSPDGCDFLDDLDVQNQIGNWEPIQFTLPIETPVPHQPGNYEVCELLSVIIPFLTC